MTKQDEIWKLLEMYRHQVIDTESAKSHYEDETEELNRIEKKIIKLLEKGLRENE